MKKVRVYYANVPNMGDMLNKEIIEELFNIKVKRSNYLFGQISGIGSGLGNYTLEGSFLKKTLKLISNIISPNVNIWGTGFISYKNKDSKLYKSNIVFNALRGELSKKRIEKLTGKKLDNTFLGDAGILSSYLLHDSVEKKYDVGIIAHYKEKSEPIFKELCDKFDNSLFIDVQDTPLNVIRKIAECRYVISSSLHGLIIADSLRVPNVHIVVTDKLLGDGFKFNDYYSAYNLKHFYVDTNKETIDDLKFIDDHYKITDEMVNEKKNGMINVFPFK